MTTWPQLNNTPIILSAMEIRYDQIDFSTSDLKKKDSFISSLFPVRRDNFTGDIRIPSPTEGVSTAQVSSKQVGYTYQNPQKLESLIVTDDRILYEIDTTYPGWETFIQTCNSLFNHFQFFLKGRIISRISIRFINKLNLKNVQSIDEYFNIGISAKEGIIEHPLDSYFLKYSHQIPDSNLNVNVSQSLAQKQGELFTFIFDIDVLDNVNRIMESKDFIQVLNGIREIKNQIFFKSLTSKTLQVYETVSNE